MGTPESIALDPLLSIADMVQILNVGRRTLERMISSGEFPNGRHPHRQTAPLA